MDETQKKSYTKNTIKLDNGKRITEVLLRYWGVKNSAKIEKNVTIDEAKELFA